MFHERNACHFCGRFVLEAEGWAESIPPYHTILATWDDESTVFNGSFHLGCVRNFERRGEFRQAIVDWLTTTNRLITVHDEDGQPHEISATGLGYTNKIAKLSDGEIYEDPRFNRWVFIEAAGPYHFLELEAAEALRAGQRVRGDGGGHRLFYPRSQPRTSSRGACPNSWASSKSVICTRNCWTPSNRSTDSGKAVPDARVTS